MKDTKLCLKTWFVRMACAQASLCYLILDVCAFRAYEVCLFSDIVYLTPLRPLTLIKTIHSFKLHAWSLGVKCYHDMALKKCVKTSFTQDLLWCFVLFSKHKNNWCTAFITHFIINAMFSHIQIVIDCLKVTGVGKGSENGEGIVIYLLAEARGARMF